MLTWVTYTMSAIRAKPSNFSWEMNAWSSTLIWGKDSTELMIWVSRDRPSTYPGCEEGRDPGLPRKCGR